MNSAIDKQEILNSVCYYARRYHRDLEDKNFMFIFRTDNNTYEKFEIEFTASNFMHLAGLELYKDSKIRSSYAFYKACLNRTARPRDFRLIHDGLTTQKKLMSLPQMIDIHKMATVIGDYNYSRPNLKTGKFIGNRNFSLGFIKPSGGQYFVPNTILQTNITKVTKGGRCTVLAVYSKHLTESKYNCLCFLDRYTDPRRIDFGNEISSLISDDVVSRYSQKFAYKSEARKEYTKTKRPKSSLNKKMINAKKKKYNRSEYKEQDRKLKDELIR